jgi:hypothetical protein
MAVRGTLAAVLVVLVAAACGSSDSSESGAAPCTKEAIAAGVQSDFADQQIEILDGFVCDGGWAAGPVLVGPSGSEEQIEAAYLVKDENGAWVVPSTLPCDSGEVPEKVLDTSPCRVS